MSNHVLYDRIWESRKLAACSLKAALAYPWIYLVADEWGRFEYSPRIIWAKVFGAREDVRAADVVAWLGEYERVGLLQRYEVGGLHVCQWTKFAGPPPSRRREATLPAPDGTIEKEGLKPRSRFHSAARSVPDGALDVGSRKLDVGSRTSEGEGAVATAPESAAYAAPQAGLEPLTTGERRKAPRPEGLGSATEREYVALLAQDGPREVAEAWMVARGQERPTLGVLRAAAKAMKAGYAVELLVLVARATAEAERHPEDFGERTSLRWTAEHNRAPDYVLRPSTLERLIPEATDWQYGRASPRAGPAPPVSAREQRRTDVMRALVAGGLKGGGRDGGGVDGGHGDAGRGLPDPGGGPTSGGAAGPGVPGGAGRPHGRGVADGGAGGDPR